MSTEQEQNKNTVSNTDEKTNPGTGTTNGDKTNQEKPKLAPKAKIVDQTSTAPDKLKFENIDYYYDNYEGNVPAREDRYDFSDLSINDYIAQKKGAASKIRSLYDAGLVTIGEDGEYRIEEQGLQSITPDEAKWVTSTLDDITHYTKYYNAQKQLLVEENPDMDEAQIEQLVQKKVYGDTLESLVDNPFTHEEDRVKHKDFWEGVPPETKARLAFGTLDLLSTAAYLVPGGNAIASGGGLVSTFGNLATDIYDDDVSGWEATKNFGMNFTGDVMALGGMKAIKNARTLGSLGKVVSSLAPVMAGALATYGGVAGAQNAYNVYTKLTEKGISNLNADEWTQLLGAINFVANLGGGATTALAHRQSRKYDQQKVIYDQQMSQAKTKAQKKAITPLAPKSRFARYGEAHSAKRDAWEENRSDWLFGRLDEYPSQRKITETTNLVSKSEKAARTGQNKMQKIETMRNDLGQKGQLVTDLTDSQTKLQNLVTDVIPKMEADAKYRTVLSDQSTKFADDINTKTTDLQKLTPDSPEAKTLQAEIDKLTASKKSVDDILATDPQKNLEQQKLSDQLNSSIAEIDTKIVDVTKSMDDLKTKLDRALTKKTIPKNDPDFAKLSDVEKFRQRYEKIKKTYDKKMQEYQKSKAELDALLSKKDVGAPSRADRQRVAESKVQKLEESYKDLETQISAETNPKIKADLEDQLKIVKNDLDVQQKTLADINSKWSKIKSVLDKLGDSTKWLTVTLPEYLGMQNIAPILTSVNAIDANRLGTKESTREEMTNEQYEALRSNKAKLKLNNSRQKRLKEVKRKGGKLIEKAQSSTKTRYIDPFATNVLQNMSFFTDKGKAVMDEVNKSKPMFYSGEEAVPNSTSKLVAKPSGTWGESITPGYYYQSTFNNLLRSNPFSKYNYTAPSLYSGKTIGLVPKTTTAVSKPTDTNESGVDVPVVESRNKWKDRFSNMLSNPHFGSIANFIAARQKPEIYNFSGPSYKSFTPSLLPSDRMPGFYQMAEQLAANPRMRSTGDTMSNVQLANRNQATRNKSMMELWAKNAAYEQGVTDKNVGLINQAKAQATESQNREAQENSRLAAQKAEQFAKLSQATKQAQLNSAINLFENSNTGRLESDADRLKRDLDYNKGILSKFSSWRSMQPDMEASEAWDLFAKKNNLGDFTSFAKNISDLQSNFDRADTLVRRNDYRNY